MMTEMARVLEDRKTVMATLCEGAPNVTVRDCLRKYDPSKENAQIERALKTEKKAVLLDTLEYLGCTDMKEYKQSALPHELICRVQNLFPDKCGLCNEQHCIKLDDRPIVSCVRCGQGCHNSCVLSHIGISEEELNESNQFGLAILNPYAALGLFYICPPCQKYVIPDKESLKRKNGPASRLPTTIDTQQQEVTPVIQQSLNQNNSTPAIHNPRSRVNSASSSLSDESFHQARDDEEDLAANGRDTDRPRPICKFYKQGRCKNGISGKKDGICNFSHPKPCRRFLANGTNQRRGCTQGSQCSDFHPQMCHRSLKDRICTRSDCKFMHIKGTKRHEDDASTNAPQPVRLMDVLPRPTNQPEATPHSVAITPSPSTEANDHITSFMKSVEDQLSRITANLNHLNQSYDKLSQQNSTTSGNPQPSPAPPSFLYQMPSQTPYLPFPHPILGPQPPQPPRQ